MDESARPARAADLEQVVALANAAIEELTPTKGGAVWVRREARATPVERSIAEAIDSPMHVVIVGQLDDSVVGYAIARLEELRDGGLLTVLDDIYVEAGARSLGIGELMMNLVLEWATERGSFGIDSMALPGNRATKNFFETFGLVARAIVVHRPLGATSPAAPDPIPGS